jgi:hypothetical protein
VLEEDGAAASTSSRAGEKRKAPEADGEGNLQRITVPGHSMVLVAFSTFFKTKVQQQRIMQRSVA